jgi:ribosomal protein S6
MVEEAVVTTHETAEEAALSRIYEVGYHIKPTAKEEDLDKIIGGIRAVIEKQGGSFIAEGAPALTRLAYPMEVREGEKYSEYDRGYFGWIKFEGTVEASKALEAALKRSADLIRFIVFRTVREDTRAKYKAPTLREVKRTDTLKTTARRPEEATVAGPVSEEQLEKALEDLTAE